MEALAGGGGRTTSVQLEEWIKVRQMKGMNIMVRLIRQRVGIPGGGR